MDSSISCGGSSSPRPVKIMACKLMERNMVNPNRSFRVDCSNWFIKSYLTR